MKRSDFTQPYLATMERNRSRVQRHNKSSAGFTLIELLVYLGMVAIALVIFTNFMVTMFANSSRADATQQLAENGRLIIAKMAQASHAAVGLNVIYGDPGIVTLTTSSSSTVYDVTNGRLRENTVPITTENVRVTSFIPEHIGNTLKMTITLASTADPAHSPTPLTLVTSLTPRLAVYQ